MILYGILALIIPITYILVGLVFWKNAPKKINATAGWRTKRAMQNQETWDLANSYAGKCMFVLGMVLIVITVVSGTAFSVFVHIGIRWIVFIVLILTQAGLFGIVFYNTENTIKINFDENGQRK